MIAVRLRMGALLATVVLIAACGDDDGHAAAAAPSAAQRRPLSLGEPGAITVGMLIGALSLTEKAVAVLVAAVGFVVSLLVTLLIRERMRAVLGEDRAA